MQAADRVPAVEEQLVGPSFESMPSLKDRTAPFNMLQDVRYDKIFAEMGCHGEHHGPDETIRRSIALSNRASPR